MNQNKRPQMYQFSHMLILVSYSILSIALIGETFLMDWEKWPLLLIAASVVICWILHIRRSMTDIQRMWVYSFLMMGTFFFYGIHTTSTYDMALLMLVEIMIFTTTGERKLIWLAMSTYYITLVCDVVTMTRSGTIWNGLTISRTALHACVFFMAGWLAQIIIRQWEELFQASDKRIEDLNEATRHMNRFMVNLSHELRTPINAILGMTDVMLDREEDPELRSSMEEVILAGHRLGRRTDDILDYSELETDNLVVNAEPCVLSSVLNDLANSLRPAVPPGLELVIDVASEIPAVLITDADKLRKILYHLISNGLRYTTEGGVYARISCIRQAYGINLFIEVSDTGVGMSGEEVENIFHYFYQADSGRSVRSGGLGIGMTIVRGFVRALGGFVTVRSSPGSGTTVHVSLPMSVADERPCMAVDSPEEIVLGGYLNFGKFSNPHVREYYNSMVRNIVHGLGMPMHRVDSADDLRQLAGSLKLTHLFVGEEEYRADPALIEELAKQMIVAVVAHSSFDLPRNSRVILMPKPFYCFPVINILNSTLQDERQSGERMLCPGLRVLVVDDEPMNLRVAGDILRRYGMSVTTAASGREAVNICKETVFDIIFMDHMMPEMDGLEAIRQIRSESNGMQSQVPVVMLTANTLSSAREMFARAGVNGFVGKPIETAELERVLKHILPVSAIRYETAEKHTESKSPEAAPPPQTEAKRAGVGQTVMSGLAACGIDVKAGLRYSQNDEDFYRTLLGQYVSEASEKRTALRRFYEAEDLPNYAITVHALKSTSKMIGAEALSETARKLEQAAKNGDMALLRRFHGGMLEDYTGLTRNLASLLGEEENTEETDDDILEFLPDGEGEAGQ
ncbi:MAG: response regulator [Oscillospiraceae bacterium]|nr:response regulator [Oscillospiraceae bacterium]